MIEISSIVDLVANPATVPVYKYSLSISEFSIVRSLMTAPSIYQKIPDAVVSL